MIRFFRRKPKVVVKDRSGEYYRTTSGFAVIPDYYFAHGVVSFLDGNIALVAPREGIGGIGDFRQHFTIHNSEAARIRRKLRLPEPCSPEMA